MCTDKSATSDDTILDGFTISGGTRKKDENEDNGDEWEDSYETYGG